MGRVRRPPFVPSALVALVLVACGSGEAAAPEPASTVGDVGHLPAASAPLDTGVTVPCDHRASLRRRRRTSHGAAPPPTTTTDRTRCERLEPVGRLVDGNRVLVIGDSILASISDRHGGQLCDRLVPRGWAVEVDAETGQHVEYGRQVLRRRLGEGWDAAVVMLGNNYGGDPVAYGAELDRPARRARPAAGRAGQRDRVQAGPPRGQLRDPGGGRAPRQRPRASTGRRARRDAGRAARRRRPAPQRGRAARPSPR